MKVESIIEAFCNTFDLRQAIISHKTIFGLFESGRLTQVLLLASYSFLFNRKGLSGFLFKANNTG